MPTTVYATPQRFIQAYGLEETTQLLADEERTLTSVLLLDAIAVASGGGWSGTPTAEEMAAAQAAYARITRELEAASNYMDGYLRGAVTLPLEVTDANAGTLEKCCCALTLCELADDTDNATDRMDERCKTWRAWLKDVQAGRVSLIGGGGEAVPGRSRVRTGQAVSGFAWGHFPPMNR